MPADRPFDPCIHSIGPETRTAGPRSPSDLLRARVRGIWFEGWLGGVGLVRGRQSKAMTKKEGVRLSLKSGRYHRRLSRLGLGLS